MWDLCLGRSPGPTLPSDAPRALAHPQGLGHEEDEDTECKGPRKLVTQRLTTSKHDLECATHLTMSKAQLARAKGVIGRSPKSILPHVSQRAIPSSLPTCLSACLILVLLILPIRLIWSLSLMCGRWQLLACMCGRVDPPSELQRLQVEALTWDERTSRDTFQSYTCLHKKVPPFATSA